MGIGLKFEVGCIDGDCVGHEILKVHGTVVLLEELIGINIQKSECY